MKNILICSALIVLFLTNCISAFDKKVKGSGNVTTEQRPVSAFDKIEVDGVFKVFLTQGNAESVEVEIDDNLQQYVKVYNEGNKLILDIEKGINWSKTTKNNVYITLKNINQLDIEGVCSVETRTMLKGDYLKLEVNGVSNSTLELNCNRLEVNLSGVGNTDLSGETIEFIVKKDGVGSLKARDMKAAKVNIKNSGVGSADVYASQELEMRNSGVGSITYSGDAIIKRSDSDGVGRIRKAD